MTVDDRPSIQKHVKHVPKRLEYGLEALDVQKCESAASGRLPDEGGRVSDGQCHCRRCRSMGLRILGLTVPPRRPNPREMRQYRASKLYEWIATYTANSKTNLRVVAPKVRLSFLLSVYESAQLTHLPLGDKESFDEFLWTKLASVASIWPMKTVTHDPW